MDSSSDTYVSVNTAGGMEGRAEITSQANTQLCTLDHEKAQLESLNRELSQMLLKINDLSSQGLLLNVEIVSQFDPAIAQELGAVVEDCEACIMRMNGREESLLEIIQEEESITTNEVPPETVCVAMELVEDDNK